MPTRTRSSRTSTARCRRSTGAAGVVHDPELTRVLLKAGADPNGEPQFGDALYHSVEAESSECLRLLLEHGARPRRSNALAHALDDHRPEHVRLLLDAGADANEGCSLLHHAAWVGNPIVVRRLLERGADPVAHSGADFDTPLAWAVHGSSGWAIEGRDYVAAAGLLVAAGAALEPRFLNAAEGPLEAWLRERAHGAQAMLDGDG